MIRAGRAGIALAAACFWLGAGSAAFAKSAKHHHHHQHKSHRPAAGGSVAEGKAHLKRANELAGDGDCAAAIEEYTKAYELLNDPVVLFNRGECYRRTGDGESAADDYHAFLEKVPNAPNRADIEAKLVALEAPEPSQREKPVVEPAPPPKTAEASRPPAAPSPPATAPKPETQAHARGRDPEGAGPGRFRAVGRQPAVGLGGAFGPRGRSGRGGLSGVSPSRPAAARDGAGQLQVLSVRLRSLRDRLSILVAVASVVAAAACQRDDSILLVEVSGDLALVPSQLAVTVTAEGDAHVLSVPPSPTYIYLPTSFTVELDRSITGSVTIAIDALDGNGYVVASGATTQSHINAGGQTIIAVELTEQTQP